MENKFDVGDRIKANVYYEDGHGGASYEFIGTVSDVNHFECDSGINKYFGDYDSIKLATNEESIDSALKFGNYQVIKDFVLKGQGLPEKYNDIGLTNINLNVLEALSESYNVLGSKDKYSEVGIKDGMVGYLEYCKDGEKSNGATEEKIKNIDLAIKVLVNSISQDIKRNSELIEELKDSKKYLSMEGGRKYDFDNDFQYGDRIKILEGCFKGEVGTVLGVYEGLYENKVKVNDKIYISVDFDSLGIIKSSSDVEPIELNFKVRLASKEEVINSALQYRRYDYLNYLVNSGVDLPLNYEKYDMALIMSNINNYENNYEKWDLVKDVCCSAKIKEIFVFGAATQKEKDNIDDQMNYHILKTEFMDRGSIEKDVLSAIDVNRVIKHMVVNSLNDYDDKSLSEFLGNRPGVFKTGKEVLGFIEYMNTNILFGEGDPLGQSIKLAQDVLNNENINLNRNEKEFLLKISDFERNNKEGYDEREDFSNYRGDCSALRHIVKLYGLKEITNNPWSIADMVNPSKEAQLLAVGKDGDILKLFPYADKDVRMAGIEQNPYSIRHITPDKDEQVKAVSINPEVFNLIKNPDKDVVEMARKVDVMPSSSKGRVDGVSISTVDKGKEGQKEEDRGR